MFRQISKAKSSLVVELQECGHIFDYQILDKHMEEDNETFSVKRCPKCSTIIKWHPRYHVQLKIQNLKINRIRNTVNTVSRVLNNSAFPLLVGSGNNSLDFVTKFGTFLAVNENFLHQADELMLAKSMLNFVRRSLQKADKGNQNYFCAYSNLKLLSILWKYFVIILYNTVQSAKDKPKEQKTEEDDSENDTDDSDDFSESEHEIMLETELSKECSKERSKKTSENDESNQEFNRYLDKIKNWFVKNKDKDTVWDPDIEVMLENVLPFLTDIGRGWMNTANVFPRLIAVVDIHSGSWRTCKIGHQYSCVNGQGSCLTCYGLDRISPQDFQIPRKPDTENYNARYSAQGARPKDPRNSKKDEPYTSNQRAHQQDRRKKQNNKWTPFYDTGFTHPNGATGKTNQNEMEGKGHSKSAVSPLLQTSGNVSPEFRFRGGFGRGRGIIADVQNTSVGQMNYRGMAPEGHVQQGYHENRPNESRNWWFEHENINQSRGRATKGGRGTRGGRGPRRGGRRGRR